MFLLLLITVCTLLVVFIKWRFSYWQRKGFPFYGATIPFGALDTVLRRERSFGMAIYDVYKTSHEKVLGIYLIFRPALLVRDAQLARDILSKEFSSFHDRGVYVDEEKDPMSAGLFQLKGQTWKNMRTKLTPSFSSGKLKGMFGTIEDVSNKMLNHLNTITPDEGSVQIEIKKLFATYAIDIIASVIFGLEVNSFKNPNNEFNRISSKLNEPTFGSVIRGTCQFLYPNLEKLFVLIGWQEEAPTAMLNLVRRTVELREKNNITRKDMLQLLLQLRNSGAVNADDNVWALDKSSTNAHSQQSLTVEMIAAQLLVFFVAGYETTASTAAFTIYELAQNPELLEKAQNDVEHAIAKHGKLSYEAVQDMKYLELCITETIRKYPALPILNRQCTQDYPIPGTKHVIEKGTPIIISLYGIQNDDKYFPDPTRYDPERFLEENMNYDPAAYMPFGEGPRQCIALRSGKINAKVAIAQVLTKFNVEVKKDKIELEIDNYGVPMMAKGGINIGLSKKK